MESEFGDRVIHFESHQSSSDPFTTAETTARANWYGISGYPTVEIDGSREFIGADVCDVMTVEYRNALNARYNEVNNVSPIEITGSFATSGSNIVYSATFRKVDPVTLTNLRATLLCYENDITWCCGYGNVNHWDGVVRDMYDQTITLTNVGDEVTVSQTIPIGSGWNTDNMIGVAYVQQTTGTTPIIQGFKMPRPYDFRVEFDNHVDSVPAGNGDAIFTGRVVNTGLNADNITLTPPTGYGAWTSAIYVCGDPNPHTTPVAINVPVGGSCDISVRVHTDGTKQIGSGSFVATSNTNGAVKTNTLRVFNNSYAIYLVNNSTSTGGGSGIWTTMLGTLGYLYDQWDMAVTGADPVPANMAGFDILIWETGYRTSALPGAAQIGIMQGFVDGGGSLFFTSQAFLNSLNNVPNAFTQNYLGIASWTLDTGYTSLLGVAADPIGDGLNMPLSFQFPSFNKGDNAVPSTATTGVRGNENSSALIHNVYNDAKVVFMPACYNAISTTDGNPNNQAAFLGRILSWLQPAPPMDADDLPTTVMASRIASIRPNPFNPRTEITYLVSARAADGPVRVEIFDMAGRKVAGVFEGRTTPGAHAVAWTGQSDLGRPVESGIYFARLTTVEGTQGSKLVLLK